MDWRSGSPPILPTTSIGRVGKSVPARCGVSITIEDDALEAAHAYAHARSLNLGKAVSELIRLANRRLLAMKEQVGVWVFDLPGETPRVTTQQVQQLLEEAA